MDKSIFTVRPKNNIALGEILFLHSSHKRWRGVAVNGNDSMYCKMVREDTNLGEYFGSAHY